MPIYSILHRWTRSTVAVLEAPTYTRALELAARQGLSLIDVDLEGAMLHSAFLSQADLRGAGLSGADLSGCYFRKADLRGADLRDTRLAHAFLGGADLRQADLRGAELSHADLRGAKLVGADLRGTILTGARLAGAFCDWRWSVIPAELLRQYPDTSGEGLRLLIKIVFHDDSRPWSWLKLLSSCGTPADWGLGALADSVRDGDNAPELLRCLTADAATGQKRSIAADPFSAFDVGNSVEPDGNGEGGLDPHLPALTDIPSAPRMLWTRRRTQPDSAARTMPDL